MSDSAPNPPIVVPPTATKDQIWTAIRDLLKVFGSALAMKGVIDASYIDQGVGALLVLGPVIWSQLKTRSNHAKLWLFARFTPDSIGQAVEKAKP